MRWTAGGSDSACGSLCWDGVDGVEPAADGDDSLAQFLVWPDVVEEDLCARMGEIFDAEIKRRNGPLRFWVGRERRRRRWEEREGGAEGEEGVRVRV